MIVMLSDKYLLNNETDKSQHYFRPVIMLNSKYEINQKSHHQFLKPRPPGF